MAKNSNQAIHRRQYRFYAEDVQRIESLKQPGESETDVIRRCLRMASELSEGNNESQVPLYRQTLRSYEPGGDEKLYEGSFDEFYSQEYLPVQIQAQTAQELAQRNNERLEVMEQLLSELLSE